MLDRKDSQSMPTQQDMSPYIHNPLWNLFYQYMIDQYLITPKYEFSKCSWEYGWNIKMKKSQKTLCTIYPRENYFTVMVVIGKKEKESFEQILPTLHSNIQNIYANTQEGNGQKWLMIDLEDDNKQYEDIKKIINIKPCGK